MKNTLSIIGALLVTVPFAQAQLLTPSSVDDLISDDYIGADSTHSKYDGLDVIGANDVFDVKGAFVTNDGNDIRIDLHANYFDNFISGNGLAGTSIGDLFISTDGLFSADDTSTDNAYSTPHTTWEYAVNLAVYSGAQAGTTYGAQDGVGLYVIEDPENEPVGSLPNNKNSFLGERDEIALSGDYQEPTGNAYRDGQEVRYLADGHEANLQDAVVTWSLEQDTLLGGGNYFLSILIEGMPDAFLNTASLGFHWTMTCGNDVIEFEYSPLPVTSPVPEPSIIGGLGVALVGLVAIRRRKQRK